MGITPKFELKSAGRAGDLQEELAGNKTEFKIKSCVADCSVAAAALTSEESACCAKASSPSISARLHNVP